MVAFDRIQHAEFCRRRASLNELHQMSGRNAQEQTDFVNRSILKHLMLTSHSEMLDIGCGDGSLLALAAAEIGAGVGIVPTQEECAKLASEQPSQNICYRVGVPNSLPATNGSFDVVVINGVLLILSSESDAEETFAEIARVLRSGGVAWIGEVVCRDKPANQKI